MSRAQLLENLQPFAIMLASSLIVALIALVVLLVLRSRVRRRTPEKPFAYCGVCRGGVRLVWLHESHGIVERWAHIGAGPDTTHDVVAYRSEWRG